MTKEEISEKRGRAIKSLNDVGAILSLDEMYIDELEKENAELKEKYIKNICDCDICDTYCNSQLTKAKDHIKKLLDCLKQDTNDPQTNYYVCQYMDKAEQFLKEIEK